MEDLRRYLDDIVGPTVADFEANPTSVRHAFLACVVTCHAADYLAFPDAQIPRNSWRQESSDFRLVDDVGHAFKHVSSSRVAGRGLHVRQVRSRPPAIAGLAVPGISIVGDTVGSVIVWGGEQRDVLAAIQQAVPFVRSKAT
jgi:hypothetical protein